MRYGVWGPPACKGRGSETQLVGMFNIMHLCLLQHAPSKLAMSTILEVTGLRVLSRFLRLLGGAVFKVFQLNHQLLGLLRLEIGIIEEEAFGEVWV